jgi:hypothetical protein
MVTKLQLTTVFARLDSMGKFDRIMGTAHITATARRFFLWDSHLNIL